MSLFESDDKNSIIYKSRPRRAASDNSDEGDVIAETPQKVKKKMKFKQLKVNKTTTLTTSDIQTGSMENVQQYLSNEFSVTRNDCEFVSANKYSVENVNVRYKRPYVFFEMKDVVNFTELYQPLNGNIKVIGVYKQKHANVHYLMEFKKSCAKILPIRIFIDFKLSNSFPVENQAIEVYGFLKFCKKEATYFPVFMVNFWTNISGDFNRYLKCLRQQKPYVPCCYKKIKLYVNDFNNLDINKSTDYSFDEIDESCLNKNVEYLEQVHYEIDQIMHISEDIFM